MILLLALSGLGLLCGLLLMSDVPLCTDTKADAVVVRRKVAIIIPARNEEENLPRLLSSIPALPAIQEIIVVDDNSTDKTAEIAENYYARAIHPGEPPPGITGKSWACTYGAKNTSADLLLFLDADTFFMPGGLVRMLQSYEKEFDGTAMSVLPFAMTKQPYEELSLFFNLLMAFGAGGFGVFQPARLFGQSLLIPRAIYEMVGGHISVGSYVLENFHLARRLETMGIPSRCLVGKNALHMRMFPSGVMQLCDSWTKAFANGAQSTDTRVLLASILWLSVLASIAISLFAAPAPQRLMAGFVYLLAAVYVFFLARKIGRFHILTCLLFPLPLFFFFGLFARSTVRRIRGKNTNWRGRGV